MKIAILSDIHGNLEAFQSVLEDVAVNKPDRIISLGDNIGYGSDPEDIMILLFEKKIDSVLGNHEFVLINEKFINWFNPTARKAVNYTKKSISQASIENINTFKKNIIAENIRFVHGAPLSSVSIYIHQLSDEKVVEIINKMDENICFVGHTHSLRIIEYDGTELKRNKLPQGVMTLNRECKYIVNAGSVGQPRDSDRRAKYVLFDTETYELEVRFVEYDNKLAAKKIVEAGLPKTYADRLI